MTSRKFLPHAMGKSRAKAILQLILSHYFAIIATCLNIFILAYHGSRLLDCTRSVQYLPTSPAAGKMVQHLDTAMSVMSARRPNKRGAGILYVTYEHDGMKFFKDAVRSAKQAKALNPSLSIAIATNHRTEDLKVFDHVIPIHPDHFDGSRQWLTRVYYMTQTPFELTLEVDCTMHFCSSAIAEDLDDELRRNSFDFAVQVDTVLSPPDKRSRVPVRPHNFALMYRWNERTSTLFHEWYDVYRLKTNEFDDQHALAVALVSAKSLDSLRVVKMRDEFAFSLIGQKNFRYSRPVEERVAMIHSYRKTMLNATWNMDVCKFLNCHLVKRHIFVDDKGMFQMFLDSSDCVRAGFGQFCCFKSNRDLNATRLTESIAIGEENIRSVHRVHTC